MSEFLEARVNDGGRSRRLDSAASNATITYVNEAGVPQYVIDRLGKNKDIADAIEQWSQSLATSGETQMGYDWFNRKRWEFSRHPFAIMSKCAWAVENDDILSTLADVLEGQMFSKMAFEMFDDDEEDIWNQWAADVDLDSFFRSWSREIFKVSQAYIGIWWEQRVYTVRSSPMDTALKEFKVGIKAKQLEAMKMQSAVTGMPVPVMPEDTQPSGKGNRTRKKKYPLDVPTAFTIFDPLKVLPVGSLMFGRERFVYIANEAEANAFDQALAGDIADSTVIQLIERRYKPTAADLAACSELGIDGKHLFLFREGAMFRHTLTKANYERLAPIRLKSVLPILEMKDHLRASDRATLIGNTNFIVVIKKGTDRLPAKAAELENLKEQSRMIARLPVLVGDHRLSVEIVTPSLDKTLMDTRWQLLDARLVFKALQTFSPISQGGAAGGSGKTGVSEMSRVVSKGLENRRHMMIRSLERFIFKEVMRRNEGVLTEDPTLGFTPRRISLDFNADVVNAILKLRDRGDISRETSLEELDFDQEIEVMRRAKERLEFDEVFTSSTPYSSPNANPYGALQPPAPGPGRPPADGTPKAPVSGSSPQGGRPAGTTETQPRVAKGNVKA